MSSKNEPLTHNSDRKIPLVVKRNLDTNPYHYNPEEPKTEYPKEYYDDQHQPKSLKICLVGPSQSGKTRYVQNLGVDRTEDDILNNLFPENLYKPTLGVQVDFVQHHGSNIVVWDIGSKYLGEGIAYTQEAHGILLFHDKNDSPPPFVPSPNIPLIHVFPNHKGDPLGELLALI